MSPTHGYMWDEEGGKCVSKQDNSFVLALPAWCYDCSQYVLKMVCAKGKRLIETRTQERAWE